MDSTTLIYFSFLFTAFLSLAYFYWKDASEEGYSISRIFDSYFYIVIGGLLGGKLLFRDISLDYFRYQLFSSPFILEGIFLGGFIGFYLYVRTQSIDPWKIGDMLSPALSSFQALVFLGLAVVTGFSDYYLIAVIFFLVFWWLRYLRDIKNLGSSKMYFERRRYKGLFLSGGLITLYLTVLSLVAMLFLVKNHNIQSNFWRFQLGFYIVILLTTYFRFRSMLEKKVKNGSK